MINEPHTGKGAFVAYANNLGSGEISRSLARTYAIRSRKRKATRKLQPKN